MYLLSKQLHLKVLAAFHQVLDVIDRWEEEVEDLEEVMFLLRESSVCQQLHQVTKVIATGKYRTGDKIAASVTDRNSICKSFKCVNRL